MQLQISHKSWDVSVLHQGGLNSSSGVSMTAKRKIVWIVAVPCSSRGKASWSGTNPALVAVLFLPLRRPWCPTGEATAEDKNPYLLSESLICLVWKQLVPSISIFRSGSTRDTKFDAPGYSLTFLHKGNPNDQTFKCVQALLRWSEQSSQIQCSSWSGSLGNLNPLEKLHLLTHSKWKFHM